MSLPEVSSIPASRSGPLADRQMLYVIGAQRAGTTWLHAQFVRHPDFHTPGLKEVHYWDTVRPPHHTQYREKVKGELERYSRSGWRDFYGEYGIRGIVKGPRAGRRIRARYDALHDQGPGHGRYADYMLYRCPRHQVIVDNTPAYALLDSATYAEMAGICRNAKFVFVMRDPVARLWSGIGLGLAGMSPEDGDRERASRLEDALGADTTRQFARSNYARTIKELEQSIPVEDIHYVFFEDLFSRPAMRALYEFVGVAQADLISEKAPPDKVLNARRVGRDLEPETRARCKERFAPVYEFIHDRFGDWVPEAWRR
jgi:hypothetical protein